MQMNRDARNMLNAAVAELTLTDEQAATLVQTAEAWATKYQKQEVDSIDIGYAVGRLQGWLTEEGQIVEEWFAQEKAARDGA
jgi:hypothetical protein